MQTLTELTIRAAFTFGCALGLGLLGAPGARAISCNHPAGGITLDVYGDLNGSGSVNVADALCAVLAVQATQLGHPLSTVGCFAQPDPGADLNCSGTVTIEDAQVSIYLALTQAVPAILLPDGAGCPAACATCAGGGASCLIAGGCVPAGTRTGADECQVCDPASDTSDWTAETPEPWYLDADDDGYGVTGDFEMRCTASGDYRALVDGDCADALPDVNPDADEVCDNGIDDDCSGQTDEGCEPDSFRNCQAILIANPGAPSGVYTLDPTGGDPSDAFDTYCDMARDGGGWTLVLQNVAAVPSAGDLNWVQSTQQTTVRGGTLSNNLGSFDMLVGLTYWGQLGHEARVEVGSNVGVPSHQAMYTSLTLTAAANYTLNLSGESITVGSGAPGLNSYHNGRPWTTYDDDNDSYDTNCSHLYAHPWWYGDCWSGSFWGSNAGGYQPASFWTGSGGDYYPWGAIWLRGTPRSCKDILDSGGSTGDGVYTIDPDGAGGNAAFQVVCDMATDGGGWTLVASHPKTTGIQATAGWYSPNQVGSSFTNPQAYWKLSDSVMNSIKTTHWRGFVEYEDCINGACSGSENVYWSAACSIAITSGGSGGSGDPCAKGFKDVGLTNALPAWSSGHNGGICYASANSRTAGCLAHNGNYTFTCPTAAVGAEHAYTGRWGEKAGWHLYVK